MTSISSGDVTLNPRLVDGYSATRTAGNIIHNIIGSEWPAVALRPAKPRAGTLALLCATLNDALALEAIHAAAATLTLVDPDHPDLNMTYVAAGDITLELDADTREDWWVRVEFQEVQP